MPYIHRHTYEMCLMLAHTRTPHIIYICNMNVYIRLARTKKENNNKQNKL